MSLLTSIIYAICMVTGILIAVSSVLLFIRFRWPAAIGWMLKLNIGALSPVFIGVGLLVTIMGIGTQSVFLSIIGIYDVAVFLVYHARVTGHPYANGSFESTFGTEWKRINAEQKKYLLSSPKVFLLPTVPIPQFQQDISFYQIPGTNRHLLCDLWQPAAGITPSGLAFIYLHGSAFYMLDKDFGTRTFFRHLAAQGHVIMDVAYRLAPETDVMGMVHDVKRAIHWMKENANSYKVNRNCIVIAGGSAGAHLALLSAYANDNPPFTPQELKGKDTSVRAVVSLYGSSDMEALYYHTNQHLTTRATVTDRKLRVPTKIPGWIIKWMGTEYHRLSLDKDLKNAGTLAPLLGGHPDECPQVYALFSVINHVHGGCPPTYFIHGDHDIMAPVESTRKLFARLSEQQVPAIMHILPQTEHGFDLIQPGISPSAHTALYEVERFLALQLKYVHSAKPERPENKKEERVYY